MITLIENQVQGGILQSLSWTLHERVGFDRSEAAQGPTAAASANADFDATTDRLRDIPLRLR